MATTTEFVISGSGFSLYFIAFFFALGIFIISKAWLMFWTF